MNNRNIFLNYSSIQIRQWQEYFSNFYDLEELEYKHSKEASEVVDIVAPLELQPLGNADAKALKIKTDLMKKITKNNETQARALMIMSRIYCILFFL